VLTVLASKFVFRSRPINTSCVAIVSGAAKRMSSSSSPTGAAVVATASSAGTYNGTSTRTRATYGRKLDKFGFIVDSEKGGNSRRNQSSNNSGGDRPTDARSETSEAAVVEGQTGTKQKKKSGRNAGGSNGNGSTNNKREKKWIKMMSDWERTTHKRKKKLQRRIRKGVPSAVRGEVWTMLAGVPRRVQDTDVGRYEELMRISDEIPPEELNKSAGVGAEVAESSAGADIAAVDQASDRNRATPRATRETIERDINRTFPRHYLFADSSDDESSDGEDFDSGRIDRDSVPVWGNGNKAVTKATIKAAIEANAGDGGTDLVAELNAVLGPAGGNNAPGSISSYSVSSKREQMPFHMSNAVIPAHNDMPESMKKKLFSAMQQCNASLEQVDMMTEEGNVPTSFLIPSSSTSSVGGEGGSGTGAAGGASNSNSKPNSGAGAGGSPTPVASRKLTRKLTREEKREIAKADYAGAKGGQASLRRVLRAYSVYDANVGYCQGMNFIAAMFIAITHKEEDQDSPEAIMHHEEEAFWLLTTVMNEEPFRCREMFGEGMSGAHRVLYVAEKLIGQFLPRLSRHLEKEGIHITMFATQWLLTLYTSSFRFELVTRVWDCFLAEGWKIVYRVMLAILDDASPKLLKLHFEEILGYFRDLPSKVNGDAIFAKVFAIPLKHRHIEKWEDEWTAQN